MQIYIFLFTLKNPSKQFPTIKEEKTLQRIDQFIEKVKENLGLINSNLSGDKTSKFLDIIRKSIEQETIWIEWKQKWQDKKNDV